MVATTPQPTSSYLVDDRRIIQCLAAFGLPAWRVDRKTNRLFCPDSRRNWTLIACLIYTVVAVFLFMDVQLKWMARLRSYHFLSSLSDSFRGLCIIYAYQILICVVLCIRSRVADYFNQLAVVDERIWQRLAVHADFARVRRSFWQHTIGVLLNYTLFSWPVSMYYYGRKSVEDALFVSFYDVTAIGLGMTSVLIQYAAHSCQVRYECIRLRLASALRCDSKDMVISQMSLRDATAAIRLLVELDELKDELQGAFSTLLSWKLAINGLNVILSVYFALFKLLHRSGADLVRAALDYTTYEFPIIVSDVLMVKHLHAIGDELDEIRAIAVKASSHPDKQIRSSLELLLLKLQHMEKTKYISANDFFPINNTMLFNMGAAIVTHMLVLLQFQQWEDNQNQMEDDSSPATST